MKKNKKRYIVKCKFCGSIFQTPYNDKRIKTCSQKCETGNRKARQYPSGNRGYNWRGENATVDAKRQRAVQLYSLPLLCEWCKKTKPIDRHHIDGNVGNNKKSNILCVCRKCHCAIEERGKKIGATLTQPPKQCMACGIACKPRTR